MGRIRLIERAHAKGREVGLCGQPPSDHPGFAAFLVDAGLDSISVSLDMLEPKASNQLEDPIVLPKKEAAINWCPNATDHALSAVSHGVAC
jgi:pyruvate,water dikinase